MAKKKNNEPLQGTEKEFLDLFQTLCRSRQSWEAWSDMVRMFAITMSNVPEEIAIKDREKRSDRWKRREEEYLHVISKYTKEEQAVFPQLLSIITIALEKNREDFLGAMYMKLELGSHWHGQFFTPSSVSQLMSSITVDPELVKAEIERRGYVSLADCACGAGVTLLSAVHYLQMQGFDTTNRVLVVAQDLDSVAGLMCYIQLSLMGCAGYVCIADSLINPIVGTDVVLPIERPEQEWWYTPMWYSAIWEGRRQAHRMDAILRKVKKVERISPLPEKPVEIKTTKPAEEPPKILEPVVELPKPEPAKRKEKKPKDRREPPKNTMEGQLSLFEMFGA